MGLKIFVTGGTLDKIYDEYTDKNITRIKTIQDLDFNIETAQNC